MRPLARVVLGEQPAQPGRRAQEREDGRGDHRAPEGDGALGSAPPQGTRRVARDLLERRGLLLEPRQAAVGEPPDRFRLGGAAVPHPHDRPGVRIRQRPEEQAVDDAEHRGVGPDAEGEDGERRQRESAVPGEHARRVADVSGQCVHDVVTSGQAPARLPESPCSRCAARQGQRATPSANRTQAQPALAALRARHTARLFPSPS